MTPSSSTVILEHAFLLFFAACDEGCTADLMKELDDLSNMTRQVNLTGKLPVPWNQLWIIQNETILLKVEISLSFTIVCQIKSFSEFMLFYTILNLK